MQQKPTWSSAYFGFKVSWGRSLTRNQNFIAKVTISTSSKVLKVGFCDILHASHLVGNACTTKLLDLDTHMVNMSYHIQSYIDIFLHLGARRMQTFNFKWPPARILTNQRAVCHISRQRHIRSTLYQNMKVMLLKL